MTSADADKIVLVMDNRNTHKLAVQYQVYAPEEARRLYEHFEVHHTPKHASWLNMAETELTVLSRQCLDRRMAHQELLRREVAAWEGQRNRAQVRVDWQSSWGRLLVDGLTSFDMRLMERQIPISLGSL